MVYLEICHVCIVGGIDVPLNPLSHNAACVGEKPDLRRLFIS
jgi:hypothetical protein